MSLDFLASVVLEQATYRAFDDETHVTADVAQEYDIKADADDVVVVGGNQVREAEGDAESCQLGELVEDFQFVLERVFHGPHMHQVDGRNYAHPNLAHNLQPHESRLEKNKSHEERSPRHEDDRVPEGA